MSPQCMLLFTHKVYTEKCSKILETNAFLSLPINNLASLDCRAWESSGLKLLGRHIFAGHNFLELKNHTTIEPYN